MTRSPSPVTQVVAIGIGAALFFVLGRFVAIPTPVPNTPEDSSQEIQIP